MKLYPLASAATQLATSALRQVRNHSAKADIGIALANSMGRRDTASLSATAQQYILASRDSTETVKHTKSEKPLAQELQSNQQEVNPNEPGAKHIWYF